MASTGADTFYWISSSMAVVLILATLFSRVTLPDFQRRALWLGLASFFVLVALLAVLSIAFDFGKCLYPSREHPYFTSGRLLSGATIPFLLLYAYATERIALWTKRKWLPLLLCAGIALFAIISEIAVNSPVFASPYNFLHIVSGGDRK